MKNYRFLGLLGFILLITPFLGIPSVFKTIIIFVIAILLLFYSFILRSASRQLEKDSQDSTFAESNINEIKEQNFNSEYTQ